MLVCDGVDGVTILPTQYKVTISPGTGLEWRIPVMICPDGKVLERKGGEIQISQIISRILSVDQLRMYNEDPAYKAKVLDELLKRMGYDFFYSELRISQLFTDGSKSPSQKNPLFDVLLGYESGEFFERVSKNINFSSSFGGQRLVTSDFLPVTYAFLGNNLVLDEQYKNEILKVAREIGYWNRYMSNAENFCFLIVMILVAVIVHFAVDLLVSRGRGFELKISDVNGGILEKVNTFFDKIKWINLPLVKCFFITVFYYILKFAMLRMSDLWRENLSFWGNMKLNLHFPKLFYQIYMYLVNILVFSYDFLEVVLQNILPIILLISVFVCGIFTLVNSLKRNQIFVRFQN